MKKILVLTPYAAKTKARQELNIQYATTLAIMLAEEGHYPVSPTLNTGRFNDLTNINALAHSDEFWMEGAHELLLDCDGVYLAQGSHNSYGCKVLVDDAVEAGIPVFKDIEEIAQHFTL